MAKLSDGNRLVLTTVELWNCRNAFEFVCPRYFDLLQATEDSEVRFCEVCREKVYLCRTPLDFVTHGELGHCVAIPEGFSPMGTLCTEMLGRPTQADIEEQDRHVRDIRAWWRGVLAERPQFAQEAIAEVARFIGQD